MVSIERKKANGRTYILVEPGVPLRDGLPPDDLARGETHDQIDVRRALGNLIHVVGQTMSLGEEDLCQVLGLVRVSVSSVYSSIFESSPSTEMTGPAIERRG
jgi:hypothetical protein